MRILSVLLAFALTGSMTLAHAGLAIVGSRVIFEEADGEAAVNIRHATGDSPTLMQVWLDDGDPQAKLGEQKLPFILTPVVARLDPGDSQVVRILRVRDALPKDRETLLYFNVLEVPPDAEQARQEGRNYLQLAMQARLKFFYRPKGLTPASYQAPDLLRFTLDPQAEAGRVLLRVHNPTPYHITLYKLALHDPTGAATLAELDRRAAIAPVIAPLSELSVSLNLTDTANATATIPAAARVHYTIINDQGGPIDKRQVLASDASGS